MGESSFPWHLQKEPPQTLPWVALLGLFLPSTKSGLMLGMCTEGEESWISVPRGLTSWLTSRDFDSRTLGGGQRLKILSLGAQGRAHRLQSPGLEGSSLWNFSRGWCSWKFPYSGFLVILQHCTLNCQGHGLQQSLEVVKIMHLPASYQR